MRDIQRPYIWFLSDTSSEPDQYHEQHIFLHDHTRIPIGTLEVHNNTESQERASYADLCNNRPVAVQRELRPLRTILSQFGQQTLLIGSKQPPEQMCDRCVSRISQPLLRLFRFPFFFSVLYVNAVSRILRTFIFSFVHKFRPVYVLVLSFHVHSSKFIFRYPFNIFGSLNLNLAFPALGYPF